MRPVDKFGNELFPHVFRKLQAAGRQLEQYGYKETNANLLFAKSYRIVHFYADMRGTSEVPIWQDPRPMVYWFFRDPVSEEMRARVVAIELHRIIRVPIRLAIASMDPDSFSDIQLLPQEIGM